MSGPAAPTFPGPAQWGPSFSVPCVDVCAGIQKDAHAWSVPVFRGHVQCRHAIGKACVEPGPVVDEHPERFGPAIRCSGVERRCPLGILRMDVRPTGYEESQYATVPAGCGFMQRRPAMIVGGIDVGAMRKQQPGDIFRSVTRRLMKGGPAAAVARVDICPSAL